MLNRFFTYSDEKIDKLIYPLDKDFFWSRLYEYKFCLDQIKKDKIVGDFCCGDSHPFKFALTNITDKVYACDLEDLSYDNLNKETQSRFGVELDKDLYDKVNFTQCNITSLPYSDKFFNLIFVISSLEHMDEETILKGLKECKRTLKDNGKIILTVDFPTLMPRKLINLVLQSGLKIDGEYNYSLPEDTPNNNYIYSDYFGEPRLYCYSMVLNKPSKN